MAAATKPIITSTGSKSVVAPTFNVEVLITSSVEGDNTVYFDYTGANALKFPNFLTTLSPSDLKEIVKVAMDKLVEIKTLGLP